MKCNVCGHEFMPKKENKYVAVNPGALFQNNTYYDCFDCPECGCQIAAQQRYSDVGQLDEYKYETTSE